MWYLYSQRFFVEYNGTIIQGTVPMPMPILNDSFEIWIMLRKKYMNQTNPSFFQAAPLMLGYHWLDNNVSQQMSWSCNPPGFPSVLLHLVSIWIQYPNLETEIISSLYESVWTPITYKDSFWSPGFKPLSNLHKLLEGCQTALKNATWRWCEPTCHCLDYHNFLWKKRLLRVHPPWMVIIFF